MYAKLVTMALLSRGGNLSLVDGAKVGAGSVVLQEVPPHTTVAGVPAKVVGRPETDQPALEMDHAFDCD